MDRRMVVFDLDGTLAYTLGDIAAAIDGALESAGFPRRGESAYRAIVGGGLVRTIRSALPPGVDESVARTLYPAVVQAYRDAPVISTRPYEGIPRLLDDLTDRGIWTSVLTNKEETVARRIVDQIFPRHPFIAVLGGRDDRPLKPDPAGIDAIRRMAGPKAETIIYVGDSGTDVRTALRAAVPFAGVLWGYRDQNDLEAAGADRLFGEVGALNRWLCDDTTWRSIGNG